jgi:hypothetical protein
MVLNEQLHLNISDYLGLARIGIASGFPEKPFRRLIMPYPKKMNNTDRYRFIHN